MDKVLEVILNEYKNATKAKKAKILEKYKFSSHEEFMKHFGVGPAMDLVVAFDTTGSMSSYIKAVREHVEKYVRKSFEDTPNLRMKIVAFGDYCDIKNPYQPSSKQYGYGNAYQYTPLTDDQNELIRFIKEAKDTSGGDGDEFYELVLKKVIDETEWRDGSKKVLLLIGDAEPHEVGYKILEQWSPTGRVQFNIIDWREEAEIAAKLGIQVDTLKVHNGGSCDWFAELSRLTNGICMDFNNPQKINQVMYASTYVRTDEVKFRAAYAAAVESKDEEMIGVYKSLSKKLED